MSLKMWVMAGQSNVYNTRLLLRRNGVCESLLRIHVLLNVGIPNICFENYNRLERLHKRKKKVGSPFAKQNI